MAAPARYWRLIFRRIPGITSHLSQRALSDLRLFDASGQEVSVGITPSQSGHQSTFGDGLSALVDGDGQTAHGWIANHRDNDILFTFDLGTPVLIDHFLVRLTNSLANNTRSDGATSMGCTVQSSSDQLTWHDMAYTPVVTPAFNQEYRHAADINSPLWIIPSRKELGGSGGIYGIVSEDGIALPNRPVYLFDRELFHRVGFATTDENGGYAFNGLNVDREYCVMSVDPSGPPYKNAIVWDRIKPINTKGNLAPQSAFWARRARDPALGAVVAVTDYVDAAAYDYMRGGQLGGAPFHNLGNYYPGMDFDNVAAVGGSLRFLRSSRSESTRGTGLFAFTRSCIFSGKAEHNRPENYQALTFEYIIRAPAVGEVPLIAVWSGRGDGNSSDFGRARYGAVIYAGGPTIEVTSQVINIRFPLSGNNRATPKASYPIVAGEVYHIAISYQQDSFIDCYINGSLAGSTAIPAAGRLWGHDLSGDSYGAAPMESWDAGSYSSNAALSWLSLFYLGGTGRPIYSAANDHYRGAIPPGHGGSFAMAAVYGRAMGASDVSNLYDSFVNWETHSVPTYQSGYAAEIEADNPALYYRMNELSSEDAPVSLVGHKGVSARWEGLPSFNETGFSAGNPAVGTATGCLLVEDAAFVNTAFSVEFMARPAVVTGSPTLFVARQYNSAALIYIRIDAGGLQLYITEPSGTTMPVGPAAPLQADVDYHIVATYDPWDSKECHLYVNGSLFGSGPAPAFPDTFGVAYWLSVGANASGTGPSIASRFDGVMGEFALYNYALPAPRVAAHYAALSI